MKLWEVLKALDENPNKRFKSVNYNQEEIIISMGTGCYDLPFKVLDSNRDWQEIKQPVTWQEAIEAWANYKKIYCIDPEGQRWTYEHHKGNTIGLEALEDGSVISPYEIKYGTWYIED